MYMCTNTNMNKYEDIYIYIYAYWGPLSVTNALMLAAAAPSHFASETVLAYLRLRLQISIAASQVRCAF